MSVKNEKRITLVMCWLKTILYNVDLRPTYKFSILVPSQRDQNDFYKVFVLYHCMQRDKLFNNESRRKISFNNLTFITLACSLFASFLSSIRFFDQCVDNLGYKT